MTDYRVIKQPGKSLTIKSAEGDIRGVSVTYIKMRDVLIVKGWHSGGFGHSGSFEITGKDLRRLLGWEKENV